MFPIEAFRPTLGKAVELFARHGIRFHLTGGLTSVVYGEPRMTQDIDLVIDNEAIAAELQPFITSLKLTDFLFDAKAIQHAVEQRTMFQLFDTSESLKLDIYPRELIAGELKRSQQHEVFEGVNLPVVSLADAAASKLVWISKGSHKSRRDLRQLFRRAGEADRRLARDFAIQLDLESLLDEVLRESDEISP